MQFEPDDLGIDLNAAGEGAETAIDAGDDVFTPDRIGEIEDAVGDKFLMLHGVDRGIDDARHDHLTGGEFHLAPDFPFVLVPPIGGAGVGDRAAGAYARSLGGPVLA